MRWTWILTSLLAGLALACTCDARAWDYVACRGTTVTSERPIAVLALESLVGVIHGYGLSGTTMVGEANVKGLQTSLTIDGQSVARLGILPSLRRLAGFVLWDQDGTIERVTTATVRGHAVRITDTVTNGRVWVRVTVGPPLGDPRVRCAVLDLSVVEDDEHGALLARWLRADTTLRLSCSAVIDLPGRCQIVRRIAERVAQREAGPELRSRVRELAEAGRLAVLDGRGRLTDSVVAEFLERVCR